MNKIRNAGKILGYNAHEKGSLRRNSNIIKHDINLNLTVIPCGGVGRTQLTQGRVRGHAVE
jgi:hypothetical protein